MCTIYSVCDDAITTIYINTTVEVEKIVEVRISVTTLSRPFILTRLSKARSQEDSQGKDQPVVSPKLPAL